MYSSRNDPPAAPWVVKDASSWVFAGTHVKIGLRLPGLVGYEYDTVFVNSPRPKNLDILAASPVEKWGARQRCGQFGRIHGEQRRELEVKWYGHL
jgi:hypothetical protein